MPTTITILSFITLFLAVFAPCVAMICKWEQTKDQEARQKRRQDYARAESDSAWILNRHARMD
jgi:hypothetical protein